MTVPMHDDYPLISVYNLSGSYLYCYPAHFNGQNTKSNPLCSRKKSNPLVVLWISEEVLHCTVYMMRIHESTMRMDVTLHGK